MDPIAPPIQSLLDLFTNALGDVRFGDVDAKTLAQAAAAVQSSSQGVAAAQASLDSAREALQEHQEALLIQAQRALAYARVYAERDEALSERLAGIVLPRSSRRARAPGDAAVVSPDPDPATAPRPRGRPRKVRPEEGEPAVPPPLPEK